MERRKLTQQVVYQTLDKIRGNHPLLQLFYSITDKNRAINNNWKVYEIKAHGFEAVAGTQRQSFSIDLPTL